MCGLEIQVAAGTVTRIRGNPDDVWSRGHLCPKGVSLGAVHHDPDRICTELLTPVIEKDGIGAVTAYTGNPLAHSF